MFGAEIKNLSSSTAEPIRRQDAFVPQWYYHYGLGQLPVSERYLGQATFPKVPLFHEYDVPSGNFPVAIKLAKQELEALSGCQIDGADDVEFCFSVSNISSFTRNNKIIPRLHYWLDPNAPQYITAELQPDVKNKYDNHGYFYYFGISVFDRQNQLIRSNPNEVNQLHIGKGANYLPVVSSPPSYMQFDLPQNNSWYTMACSCYAEGLARAVTSRDNERRAISVQFFADVATEYALKNFLKTNPTNADVFRFLQEHFKFNLNAFVPHISRMVQSIPTQNSDFDYKFWGKLAFWLGTICTLLTGSLYLLEFIPLGWSVFAGIVSTIGALMYAKGSYEAKVKRTTASASNQFLIATAPFLIAFALLISALEVTALKNIMLAIPLATTILFSASWLVFSVVNTVNSMRSYFASAGVQVINKTLTLNDANIQPEPSSSSSVSQVTIASTSCAVNSTYLPLDNNATM